MVKAVREEADELEEVKTVDEFKADIKTKADDWKKFVADLEKIDAEMSKLKEKKKAVYSRMMEKGCGKKGLEFFYKRHGRPEIERNEIEATLQIAEEQTQQLRLVK